MSMIKEPIITDRTGKQIASYLGILAGVKAIAGDLTYAEISRIVRSGGAAATFNIGDQIITTYTATNGKQYEMPWNIIHMGNVILADGSFAPGMLIQSHYATVEEIQFDAPEPDNTLGTDGATDSAVATYGYNRYSESGYRAWLNSPKKAGEWFGTTFERNGKIITRREADVAPSQLNSVNGFMAGLPDDFLSILKPVQITTACNTVTDGGVIDTTYDTFFLPSLENLCVAPEADAGTEGGNYDYWLERVGTTARKKESSFPRGITYDIKNHTTARNVILRSAKRGYSHNMRYVSYTGSVGFAGSDGYGFANKGNASTPICAIC